MRLGRVTERDVFADSAGVNRFTACWTRAPQPALTETRKQVGWSGERAAEEEKHQMWRAGSDRTPPQPPPSWIGLLPSLPLTFTWGFLCQRTSCTCRLENLEVEPQMQCWIWLFIFSTYLWSLFSWYGSLSDGRKWLIRERPEIWAVCFTGSCLQTKHILQYANLYSLWLVPTIDHGLHD